MEKEWQDGTDWIAAQCWCYLYGLHAYESIEIYNESILDSK